MKKLHLKIQQIPMFMFWRLFVVCSILTLFYCEVTMYWCIDKLKELNPNLVLPDLNDAPVKEYICAQDDQSHTEVLTSLSGYIQNVQQIPSIQH